MLFFFACSASAKRKKAIYNHIITNTNNFQIIEQLGLQEKAGLLEICIFYNENSDSDSFRVLFMLFAT